MSLPDCGVATSDSILTPEQALLAKLEEENRRIEADAKCPSLTTVHSRKSSDTSQISLASGKVDKKKMVKFCNAKPRQVFPTMRCIFLLKHVKGWWQNMARLIDFIYWIDFHTRHSIFTIMYIFCTFFYVICLTVLWVCLMFLFLIFLIFEMCF